MKITIYSTPTCPYCVMVKRYLDDLKVAYEEVDVSHDEKQAQTMQQKSGQLGVPVAIFGLDDGKEEVVIGFDKDQIDKILNLSSEKSSKS